MNLISNEQPPHCGLVYAREEQRSTADFCSDFYRRSSLQICQVGLYTFVRAWFVKINGVFKTLFQSKREQTVPTKRANGSSCDSDPEKVYPHTHTHTQNEKRKNQYAVLIVNCGVKMMLGLAGFCMPDYNMENASLLITPRYYRVRLAPDDGHQKAQFIKRRSTYRYGDGCLNGGAKK